MFLLYCEILFTFFELDYYFLGLFFFFAFLHFLLKTYSILNKMKYNFISGLLSLLFSTIFFSNYLSMIPFSFVYSSQLFFCLFMSLSFFFSFSFFPKVYNMKTFFSHLCPEGIPFMLAPMLIIIEIISFFMRPIALFSRLFANITASHVLLSIFVSMVPLYMSFIIFPLLLLEMMVCSIQAYIFSLLLLLWFNE